MWTFHSSLFEAAYSQTQKLVDTYKIKVDSIPLFKYTTASILESFEPLMDKNKLFHFYF